MIVDIYSVTEKERVVDVPGLWNKVEEDIDARFGKIFSLSSHCKCEDGFWKFFVYTEDLGDDIDTSTPEEHIFDEIENGILHDTGISIKIQFMYS